VPVCLVLPGAFAVLNRHASNCHRGFAGAQLHVQSQVDLRAEETISTRICPGIPNLTVRSNRWPSTVLDVMLDGGANALAYPVTGRRCREEHPTMAFTDSDRYTTSISIASGTPLIEIVPNADKYYKNMAIFGGSLRLPHGIKQVMQSSTSRRAPLECAICAATPRERAAARRGETRHQVVSEEPNSFKFLRLALYHEIARQSLSSRSGGVWCRKRSCLLRTSTTLSHAQAGACDAIVIPERLVR